MRINPIDAQRGVQVEGRQGLILVKDKGNMLILQRELRLKEIGTLCERLPDLLLLVKSWICVRWRINWRNHDIGELSGETEIHHTLQAVFRRPERILS